MQRIDWRTSHASIEKGSGREVLYMCNPKFEVTTRTYRARIGSPYREKWSEVGGGGGCGIENDLLTWRDFESYWVKYYIRNWQESMTICMCIDFMWHKIRFIANSINVCLYASTVSDLAALPDWLYSLWESISHSFECMYINLDGKYISL